MKFLFYFRLSSYLFISAGFLALLITDEYGVMAALIFTAIILFGWHIDSRRISLSLSRFFWNLATVGFLAFCLLDILFLRKIPVVGLVNFLVFLQAAKILAPKRDHDYVTIYIISFFELLISSIMTFSILFALSCLLFIVTGTWALIIFQLKQEIQIHLSQSSQHQQSSLRSDETGFHLPAVNSLLNGRIFAGTFGITISACLLSVLVFAILPRVQEGSFLRYGNPIAQSASGFSEEVALDSFGTIRLDHTPIMRVELPEISHASQLPERLYWKGITYNHYDGRRWKSDDNKQHRLWPLRYQPQVWLTPPPRHRELLTQRFTFSSTTYHVLFAANTLYGIGGRFLSFQYDPFTGNTQLELSPYSPQYTAYSDVTRPAEHLLRQDHRRYPDDIRRTYLQLPELGDRIANLAYDVSQNQENPYDIAISFENYLLQNYAYSLSVQRSSDLLPIDDFLFVNQAGHCEYYATSMTLLLRILGIPARVVNGFAQGRWNEFGHFFTVRQSDAHAWVEIYFPSYGWQTFDPTPASAFGETYQQLIEQSNLAARLYRYSEYLRTRWNRYIIDYSVFDQARLAVDAFQTTHSIRQKISTRLQQLKQHMQDSLSQLSPQQRGISIGIFLIGLLCLYLIRRSLPGFSCLSLFGKRPSLKLTQHIRFYTTMLHILSRKGMIKGDAVTPGEFVREVSLNHPGYEKEVAEITQMYYRVRYGRYDVRAEEFRKIQTMLRVLKQRRFPRR